ncbi:4-hydroxybenzoate transporter [Pseudonocardia sp. N23]|nr:4-hydroxybenzoate transporter [Pseudonocardia sp. N23]
MDVAELIDRAPVSLVIAFLVAIVGVIGITASTTLVPLLLVSVVLAGVGVVGGQTGISVLASAMYPTRTRAAGVGWAYGVGRLGSIVGPGVSGLLLAAGLGPTAIVALAAAPTALATCGIGVLARYGNRPDPDSDGLPATGDPSAVDPAVIRETG